MGQSMTKSSNDLFAQQRFRPAWASAQSDQSICCSLEETLGSQLPSEYTAKTDQTGWMPRLICIFAEPTVQFVGFVVLRLI